MTVFDENPHIAEEKLANVTNTLAYWLPSNDDATVLQGWDEVDWRAAAWVVYWQCALPWFVGRLQETNATVPQEIWESLYAIATDSRERTRRMLDATVELLNALHTEAIRTLPLKGVALAPLYYADPLRRPLGDLDILVHKSDIQRGVAVLQRLGYHFFSRSAEDEVYLRGERKANIWAPDNVHLVEMHYALREEYAGLAYDLADKLWASARWQPYWGGIDVWTPDAPTLLHHVCAHATSDLLIQRGRLMHLDDIRVIAARMSPQDWETFVAGIPAEGARFVYPILAFAQRYAAPPIPDVVMEKLAANTPPPLRAWIVNTELADTSMSNLTSRSGSGLDMVRLLARSPWERGQMWLRSFFPRRRHGRRPAGALSKGTQK